MRHRGSGPSGTRSAIGPRWVQGILLWPSPRTAPGVPDAGHGLAVASVSTSELRWPF